MCRPKNLRTAKSIPASMRPNEFPAVATQSKLDRDSNDPRCTSRSETSLAIQRTSSAVSLLRVVTMKRMGQFLFWEMFWQVFGSRERRDFAEWIFHHLN